MSVVDELKRGESKSRKRGADVKRGTSVDL